MIRYDMIRYDVVCHVVVPSPQHGQLIGVTLVFCPFPLVHPFVKILPPFLDDGAVVVSVGVECFGEVSACLSSVLY